MEKSEKNPLLAGLFNMLVPGSVNIYIKKNWRKFILTFAGMIIVLAIVIWAGVSLQGSRSFSLPQGVCPGVLALIVLVPLFLNGLNAAREYNKILEDKVLYDSRKPVSQDDDDEQLKKIQKMRDEGLISEQQYNTRKSKVDSKK
jgi:predicted permease